MADDTAVAKSLDDKKTKASIDKRWHIAGLVLVCFVASFLGAWLFLATGLVRLDTSQAIVQNRDKIVLQQGEIVSDVFAKVSPSTVAITTEAVVASGYRSTQQIAGEGSGIVLSKDGYILTNKHVVPNGTRAVTVVMADGKQYENVKVVGRDPFNDIAFLKIDDVDNLTPAQFGDSTQVKPGQQVVAIGNALGQFRNSVSAGIISGLGRPIQAQDDMGSSEQLEDLFQTDAAINPGNSGGPLVNLAGEVIGINTAVSEEGQAIGFAIPIHAAKKMIDSVLKTGKVVKPYLGVRYISLNPETAKELGAPLNAGALIAGGGGQVGVIAGSPAAKAGLREGDIITKIDDQVIDTEHGLTGRLSQYAAGDKVRLMLYRPGGKEQQVTVTLEAYESGN